MPAGLVEEEHGVRSACDPCRDFKEMLCHGGGVATGHDDAGNLSLGRADRPEQVGGRRSLIFRRARSGAPFCPTPCNPVLLAHSCFVLPPYFYWGAAFELGFDFREFCGEVFLNAGIAFLSWA